MNKDDLQKKASDAAAKAKDALGEMGSQLKDEEKTDAALDKAAVAAKKLTGGRFGEKIDQARAALDKQLGTE